MPRIRVLPPEIVNRIAAGEVVERPASVVKELVENSIDAGATRISIELEDGGSKLILVRDNGWGLEPDDIPLAFESHATSKLTEEDLATNLLGVSTLGFRGEALASIASVAMVELTTKTHDAPHATRYRPGGGADRSQLEPAAGENGTTIEVRNLFYNVPARRKFLRSNATELSHVIEQVTRIALGFPGIQFRLTHARRPLLDLPAVDSLGDRVRQLLVKEAAAGLLEVAAPDGGRGGPRLHGFVGGPRVHRKDAHGQSFFVNGRWVRDRVLSAALRAAYQGFHIPGYQPVAYLFLDLPAGDVDVNVHPTKSEVRFRDSSELYRLVFHGVKAALDRSREAEASSRSRELPAGEGEPFLDASLSASSARVEPLPSPEQAERARVEQAALDFFASPPRPAPGPRPAASPSASGRPPGISSQPLLVPSPGPGAPAPATAGPTAPALASVSREISPRVERRSAIQVLNSYLLLETGEGIVLIDQHAFHEKILFEEIHRRILGGEIEKQRLLVPDLLDLPHELLPLVEEAAELLRPLGFDVELFGPSTAAIHALPAILDRGPGRPNASALVRSVLETLRSEGGGARARAPVDDRVRHIAATIACKRAVKAGMALSPSEIDYLLERGHLAEDPRHCPHGRPTSVTFLRRDIERAFDRK